MDLTFTAKAVRRWLNRIGVKTLFIELGSPWENGYIESFNRRLRDDLLNGEIFTTLIEAMILIEKWRKESIIRYDRMTLWDTDHLLLKQS